MARHCLPIQPGGDAGIGFVCGNFGSPPANPMPRARCPLCQLPRPLKQDGTFRKHTLHDPPTGRPLGDCPASGLTPEQARQRRGPTVGMPAGHHRCPRRGCPQVVPNRLFACRADWFALSTPTRRQVYATAHLPLADPERRRVFQLAELEWDAQHHRLQQEVTT